MKTEERRVKSELILKLWSMKLLLDVKNNNFRPQSPPISVAAGG